MHDPILRRSFFRRVFCSSAALQLNLLTNRADTPLPKSGGTPSDHNILLIGDFGSDDPSQAQVAEAMQSYVAKNGFTPDWLILLGDNFYGDLGPLTSITAERWLKGFETMYPTSVFPGPCPAILGNHDYLDWLNGPETQLDYPRKHQSRWHMPSKWYRKDLGKTATFLFLDTNLPSIHPFETFQNPSTPQSFHLSPTEEAAQWDWLDSQLASPRGAFTFVVGHHPVFSNGMHGDHRELIASLSPRLRKHQAHFYLAAHDHDLQHLEIEGLPTSFVISGGGGAHQRPFQTANRPARFFRSILGFTHLSLNMNRCIVRHVDVHGTVLHAFEKLQDLSWRHRAS